MSLGYFIDRSEIQFEYNNPLYSEDISLVFGFETKSLNALLFKSKSHRTSKTIFVEIVSEYFILKILYKFSKLMVSCDVLLNDTE